MRTETVPRKQLFAAGFTALLSPLLRVVPRQPALWAGRWAWLTPLAAAPALLLLILILEDMAGRRRPGEGMGELILRALGPVGGRIALALYGGWIVLYTAFVLRSGAMRLTAAVYRQSAPGPFFLILLLLCLTAALGTVRAAARMGYLLRVVLLAAMAVMLLLAARNLRREDLLPLTPGALPGVLRGGLPLAAVGGAAGLFSFLGGYTDPAERGRGPYLTRMGLFLTVSALVCLEAVGVFGPKLTARLSYPFFTMIRDISLAGLAQRFDAAVIVLWICADFMLCALLMRCGFEVLRGLCGYPGGEAPFFSLKRGRYLLWLEAGAILIAGRYIAADAESYRLWSETLVPAVMAAFVYGGFPLILLIGRLRGRI